MNRVTLQTATSADAEFLYALLKLTMQDYVDQTWGWDEQWQQHYFQEHFIPENDQLIIKDDQRIGVISTEKTATELVLSKIFILPRFQGQGLGTALIRTVIDEAARCGLPVVLRVLKANSSAKRLYERLGFVVTNTTETHNYLKLNPAS